LILLFLLAGLLFTRGFLTSTPFSAARAPRVEVAPTDKNMTRSEAFSWDETIQFEDEEKMDRAPRSRKRSGQKRVRNINRLVMVAGPGNGLAPPVLPASAPVQKEKP